MPRSAARISNRELLERTFNISPFFSMSCWGQGSHMRCSCELSHAHVQQYLYTCCLIVTTGLLVGTALLSVSLISHSVGDTDMDDTVRLESPVHILFFHNRSISFVVNGLKSHIVETIFKIFHLIIYFGNCDAYPNSSFRTSGRRLSINVACL